MSRFVIPLSARAALRPAAAGGKASTLARLLTLGIRVPEGFIVSTAVFHDLVRRFQRRSEYPGRLDSGDGMAEHLRAFLRTASFPAGSEHEIRSAFRSVGGPVAVRSSMIGEDQADSSFAGQLETFLDIDEEERLLEAIRDCLASALAERVSHYLDARSRSLSSLRRRRPAVAVLVQRMVPAQAAGVAFGADPATGRFCVVIEATRGLGHDVVSGRANPDRYVIGRGGAIIETRCAGPAPPVLDEVRVRELACIVRDLEGRLDAPLDIEWAHDGAGFLVLQARPIGPLTRVNVYSRRLAADMAPGLIKPLLWSTSILDMTRHVFTPVFAGLLGRRDFDGTQLVQRIHGRVYANATLFASLLGRAGLPFNLFEAIARDEPTIRPRLRRAGSRAIPALLRLMLLVLRHGWMGARAESFLQRHERYLEELRRQTWDGREPRDLYRAAGDLRRAHGDTQWFIWATAMNMTVRRKLLDAYVRRHAPDIDATRLLAGCDELRSLAPNIRLAAIAAALRAVGPDGVEVAGRGDDGLVREYLARRPEGAAVLALFASFMEQYGHLSASGTDFTVAPWAETPGRLWRTVAREAALPRNEDRSGTRPGAGRCSVVGGLGLADRFVLRRLLATVCRYLILRDRMSFVMSGDAHQARRIYLALGRALVDGGALNATEDLFYLEFDEIGQILDDALFAEEARERIRSRQAELAEAARIDPEDVIFGQPQAGESEPVATGDYLEGIGGSAGVVRGFARVVRDPSEVDDTFGPEDLLVVPFMDIGWTPLFRGVGGIVAETGGQLSHSAIVAREYGIPAVVGVAGAMRLIRDGQPLTVDGTRGRVYLSHT